jgi:precorrin-6A synthase
MRTVLVIGIGLGDPDHLTVQAIAAINRVDVFFAMEKETAGDELRGRRQAICARYATSRPYRFINAPDPVRDRRAPGYDAAVADWSAARAEVYRRLLVGELADGQCAGLLAWGDPAFYDSTLRVLDRVVAGGAPALEIEVVPGISSIQVLAAAHRISLTRVGRPVHLTTGRRLATEGLPEDADDVIVMLDGHATFAGLDPNGLTIYWGAYLGTPQQILVAGELAAVAEEIVARRNEARARRGWIMDTYLLRRQPTTPG